MTVKLSPTSSRAVDAKRFGAELAKAMRARKASAIRLAAASGCAKSAIANWKAGGNLPRVETAARLAEVLHWPRLLELARDARTLPCARCKRPFLRQTGAPARFCSVDCREIDEQLRKPAAGAELAAVLSAELAARAHVRGGLRKGPLKAALDRYNAGDAKRIVRVDKLERALAAQRSAIAAMCAGCEPAGLCRQIDCALRPVSPLPLASATEVSEYEPAEGPWGETHRAKVLAAIQAGNAERWAREGERERQSERSTKRHAKRTPEEKAAFAAKVSAGRRRAA